MEHVNWINAITFFGGFAGLLIYAIYSIVTANDTKDKESWKEIANEFRAYRNSLDGTQTIHSFEFFLEQRFNPPTRKPIKQ